MRIFMILLIFFCINPVFAQTNTTISNLELNVSCNYDIEIFMDANNKIFVPVKQIAKILEKDFTQNHSKKEITLNTNNGNIIINKNGVFLKNNKISSKVYFSKEGIIEPDEFYIDDVAASKIFNSKISTDNTTLFVYVQNEDIITIAENKEFTPTQKEPIQPKQKGKLSFDTFEINNSMISDSTKQVYLNATQNNVMFNNNTRMSLKGKLYGGDYSLNFNTNNYAQQFFSFGGLSFTYKNKWKKFPYELGQVSGFKDQYNSIGTMLVGAQISNYDENEKNALQKENKPLKKGEKQQRAFIGLSGYNNRLFSSNGYIYQMTSKKLVFGAGRRYGLSDKINIDTKIIYDKIFQKNDDAIFISSLYNDYSILSSGIYKNPNTLQGATAINTMSIYKNKNHRFDILSSLSLMNDLNYATSERKPGYSFSIEDVYERKNTTLKLKLYQQSPNYYVAGSDSGFICDRIGGQIAAVYAKNNLSANLRYTRYYSNLDKTYSGGLIAFDEGYINLSAKTSDTARLRFSGNIRQGKNNIGYNLNYYYNLNYTKNFRNNLTFEAGRMGNSYDSQYKSLLAYSNGYKSTYDTAYINATYRLPKNKGAVSLGHDIVNYKSNGAKNDYKMIKINYRFPEFKRILLGIGIGYKYQGLDGGCTYSAAIGYRTKTGMVVSVNYQYNSLTGYMFNNMYIPSNSRHSINFTINDTFAFANNGIESIGTSNFSDNGFVEIVAFIDKNNNGIFDKNDLKVSNVPVKTSWKSDSIKTKRNGFCPLQSVEKGIWEVKLDLENMHTNLSALKSNTERVCVEAQKITRVEFPLKSSVGNISGNLKVMDDFRRKMDTNDFIVVLNDENGKEVAYSTTDKEGKYYFSGISPGRYKIMLDKNFINDYGLTPDSTQGERLIEIPYVYKKFVELKNQDLLYKYYWFNLFPI